MESKRAIQIIQSKIDAIDALARKDSSSPEFTKWRRDTEVALERIFGQESRHKTDFTDVRYSLFAFSADTPESAFHNAYLRGLSNAKDILLSIVSEIREFDAVSFGQESSFDQSHIRPDAFSLVELICLRFHYVARQLRSRHADRQTLSIEDEYDAQDLFHALLKLHFDDVRPEEWTPNYAGGSSRVDFLLKEEQIIVELKKTRPSLKDKNLGEELMVDAVRYKAHPDCQALICFVYDPEGRVGNPVGLERDLESMAIGLKIRVIVAPKGS
ncbi:hypothetical protein [Luteimonas sp. FCS-9]|uniref:PD-(D/E)XK nuclease domain-containing protein n=1 Tax=Luteimonas sp. FCS-9 TaxID=1547516 RepID=UPI000B2C6D67|nr:hypothetical protein [Luteimonas sp. FCS-9]